jgi:hypothetical protein
MLAEPLKHLLAKAGLGREELQSAPEQGFGVNDLMLGRIPVDAERHTQRPPLDMDKVQ